MKKDEKKTERTPEEALKQRKRMGIVLIVFGVLILASCITMGIIMGFTDTMGHIQMSVLLPLIYCVPCFGLGLYVLLTAKKKYEKDKLKEQEKKAANAAGKTEDTAEAAVHRDGATSTAKTFQGSAIDLSKSEPGDELREAHGRNLLEMLKKPEEIEKISFINEPGDMVEYDLLWGNVYDGVTYIVVGHMEDVYMKYIFFVSNSDPTKCYAELNDSVREPIKTDFMNAINAYAQQNGQAAPDSGEKKGRFSGFKQRFITNKPDTGKIKTFIALSVIYAVILAVGLAGYFTGFGLEGESLAIAKAICISYAFITPSYFIYFGSHNPFGIKKGLNYLFVVLGIAGMVVCVVFGFNLIPGSGEISNEALSYIVNNLLPISLIVATASYIAAYVVWCKGLSSGWYLGVGIAATLLFPVVTALIIAVFVIYMLILIVCWLLSALGILVSDTPMGRGFKQGWSGSRQGGAVYQITDENGYTHTL